jgi:putative transposase
VPADRVRSPFCVEEAQRLARSASPGTGRPYGVQRVCRIFGMARSTAYYLKAREAVPPEQRPVPRKRGPVGAATDDDLVGHIRRVLAESPFTGEGYRKVWARLRHQGIRTASERVRRLMREHHLQAPRRGGNAHGPKAHDGTITTEEPDTMWGTDMTTTVTAGEGTAHVFVAVDHCTCECVGLHAAKRGNRFEALEPLRQGVREHFGGFEAEVARGLAIRHDHGSNYLSDDFQRELRFLGMASSPSFVREPEGNGCAERFIRTLKEQLLWVRSFATVAELVEALGDFKRTYNERWVIRRHGHRTPSQVRRDLASSRAAAA